MNSEVSHFPTKLIIHRRLILAHCVLPTTLKNYAAGLTCFTKFCDDFNIPETDHIPASEVLLLTFVTTYGASSVGKGAIKMWILGLEHWHRIHNALWLGGAVLQQAVEGSTRLAPKSSHLAKCNPIVKNGFLIRLNGKKVEAEQRMTSKENVRVKLSSRAVVKEQRLRDMCLHKRR